MIGTTKHGTTFESTAKRGAKKDFGLGFTNIYKVRCYDKPKGDPTRKLKWEDEIYNLVVDVGLNDALDKYFKASAYTPTHYVGLTGGSPSFAAGHTIAAHSGWTEVTSYSSNRKAITWGSVASKQISNTSSTATFNINSNSTTIGGAFICNHATATSTSNCTLYGGGAFTGGNKTLDSGDTLSVTVTVTAASS